MGAASLETDVLLARQIVEQVAVEHGVLLAVAQMRASQAVSCCVTREGMVDGAPPPRGDMPKRAVVALRDVASQKGCGAEEWLSSRMGTVVAS